MSVAMYTLKLLVSIELEEIVQSFQQRDCQKSVQFSMQFSQLQILSNLKCDKLSNIHVADTTAISGDLCLNLVAHGTVLT